jgi:hypothetical protein
MVSKGTDRVIGYGGNPGWQLKEKLVGCHREFPFPNGSSLSLAEYPRSGRRGEVKKNCLFVWSFFFFFSILTT